MNKSEEESIFNRFKENFSNFPDGDIRIQNQDRPDVVIIDGNKKIGIEITQVFIDQNNINGSDLKSFEKFQIKLLEAIKRGLEVTDLKKCGISVSLNKSAYFRILNGIEIGNKSLPIIKQALSDIEYDGEYEIENCGQFHPIIESFFIDISEYYTDFQTFETGGSVLKPLTNNYIQFILDEKELKMKNYEYCDSYWLIIKEGSFIPDSFSKIDIDRQKLRTSFDKVFLLRQTDSKIEELK